MWSLLCIPPLAAMVISDLRSRRIGIVHLIIFGITLLTASLLEFGWCQVLVNISFNLLTVLLLWLFLYGYSSMRKRRLADMIGGGDFAFALAAMVISDLRSRRIGIVHLIIFGITLLMASLLEFGWRQVLVNASSPVSSCKASVETFVWFIAK